MRHRPQNTRHCAYLNLRTYCHYYYCVPDFLPLASPPRPRGQRGTRIEAQRHLADRFDMTSQVFNRVLLRNSPLNRAPHARAPTGTRIRHDCAYVVRRKNISTSSETLLGKEGDFRASQVSTTKSLARHIR